MSDKNIQMHHYKNGVWDKMYPVTRFNNVYDENGNDINTLSNNIKKKTDWINPESFDGTDTEKLQSSIDLAVVNKQTIVLTKKYDITGNTLKINKPKLTERSLLRITGLNGGIVKNDSGFIFDSDTIVGDMILLGDINISNLKFESTVGSGVKVFNGDKMIRVFSINNQYQNIDTIAYSDSEYLQTYYLQNDHITGGSGYAIEYKECFDVKISNCVVEHRDAFLIHKTIDSTQSDLNPTGKSSNSLKIINNLIEGLRGSQPAIKLGFGSSVTISDNYFELNAGVDIDLSSSPSYGFTASGNFFHDTNGSKNCVELPNVAVENEMSNQYVFINNFVRGGASLFNFNKKPHNWILIVSIGNHVAGGTLIKNYRDRFNILNKNYQSVNGTTDITKTNNIKILRKKKYSEFDAGTTGIVEVDMEEYIDINKDVIVVNSVSDNGSLTVFDITNVFTNDTKVKVVVKSNNSSARAGVNVYVKVLKY